MRNYTWQFAQLFKKMPPVTSRVGWCRTVPDNILEITKQMYETHLENYFSLKYFNSYGICEGEKVASELLFEMISRWQIDYTHIALSSMSTVPQSKGLSFTHSHTNGRQQPCKALSIPIGSNCGSVSCTRSLQHVDNWSRCLSCQPFNYQFAGCSTNWAIAAPKQTRW